MTTCLAPNGPMVYRDDAAPTRLLVGTTNGIVCLERASANAPWRPADRLLEGRHISTLLSEPRRGGLFAGVHNGGTGTGGAGAALGQGTTTGSNNILTGIGVGFGTGTSGTGGNGNGVAGTGTAGNGAGVGTWAASGGNTHQIGVGTNGLNNTTFIP